MGDMLQAVCECGYQSNILFVGGGMIDLGEICKVPYYCENCKYIGATNILMKNPENPDEIIIRKTIKCSKCRRKVQHYGEVIKKTFEYADYVFFQWELEDENSYIVNDKYYYCPKCKKIKLKFYPCGNWD